MHAILYLASAAFKCRRMYVCPGEVKQHEKGKRPTKPGGLLDPRGDATADKRMRRTLPPGDFPALA